MRAVILRTNTVHINLYVWLWDFIPPVYSQYQKPGGEKGLLAAVDTAERVVEGAVGEEVGFEDVTLVCGWGGSESGYYGSYFRH